MSNRNNLANHETVSIPVDRIHSFRGHPYKVQDNEEMNELIRSIQAKGILTPVIVRPLEGTENEYEIVSGHRRVRAAQKAGITEVPAYIFAVSREEAAVLLVDSNLHRERLLPSEKAFAYKLKMDALRHQGTSSQLGTKLRTDAQMAIESGESRNQIQRYIRLTHLIPELLQYMDEDRMALSVGVELSFLDEKSQRKVLDAMQRFDCTPSYSQANRLRKSFNAGVLTTFGIDGILCEEKPNQKERIHLKRENYAKFFPSYYTDTQIERDILAGLDLLRKQRLRERNRNER